MQREAPVRRLALLIEYEGTAYGGSQYQKNAPTIQGSLERALSSLTGEPIRVALAGRTDAGVHARGQVASFLTASRHPRDFWLTVAHGGRSVKVPGAYFRLTFQGVRTRNNSHSFDILGLWRSWERA